MPRPKSKGLGDTIEKVIKATGLDNFVNGDDCGCQQRKEYLNKIFPYRFKARCLTEQEYKEWSNFKEVRTLRLSSEQVSFVINLYASVFNVTPFNCPTCSPKVILEQIDRLDKVHETYLNG
jgi:hypothetical protein